jgi:hypothetical protein
MDSERDKDHKERDQGRHPEEVLFIVLRKMVSFADVYSKVLAFRKILPTMNIQKVQDYALAVPESNRILETLQLEVP